MGLTVTQLLRLRRFESCSPHFFYQNHLQIIRFNFKFAHRLPTFLETNCESSSVGRASAFQAECRGFDPRLSLKITNLTECDFFLGRLSSGVECFLGKEEVTGSNPVVGSKGPESVSGFFFMFELELLLKQEAQNRFLFWAS